MLKTIEVLITSVKIGPTNRKDLGNLKPLVRSMAKNGLFLPIILSPGGELISGRRRLAAAEELGWRKIAAVRPDNVDELLAAVAAEAGAGQARSHGRKQMSCAELIDMGRRIEAGFGKTYRVGYGISREWIGKAIGMSGTAYRRGKVVVLAAEADPGTFGRFVEIMNAAGATNGAYRELQLFREKNHGQAEGAAGAGAGSRDSDSMATVPAAPKGRPGRGIDAAVTAINILKTIPDDDPELTAMLRQVSGWINKRKKSLR